MLFSAECASLFANAEASLLYPSGRPLPRGLWPQNRAARGETFHMRVALRQAEGALRLFEASGQPLTSAAGRRAGIVLLREVGPEQAPEEAFLAMAGHELRTPLTVLKSYLELLLRLHRHAPGSAGHHYASIAFEECLALQAFIEQLLDADRLRSGAIKLALEILDLSAFVQSAMAKAQAVVTSHALRFEATNGRLVVRADRLRLEQALLALVENAGRYAPHTDHIHVRVGRSPRGAAVAVQDHGTGVDADILDELFKPFYQAPRADHPARRGLGLGLFISRHLARLHGGELEVTSGPQGATFTIHLPLAAGEASVPGQAPADGASSAA